MDNKNQIQNKKLKNMRRRMIMMSNFVIQLKSYLNTPDFTNFLEEKDIIDIKLLNNKLKMTLKNWI